MRYWPSKERQPRYCPEEIFFVFSLSKKCQLLWIIFMLKKSKGKYFLFFFTIGVIASLSKFTTRDKLNISTPSYILILYFFVVLLEVTVVNKNYGWWVIVAIILLWMQQTLSIDNRKSTSNLTSTTTIYKVNKKNNNWEIDSKYIFSV